MKLKINLVDLVESSYSFSFAIQFTNIVSVENTNYEFPYNDLIIINGNNHSFLFDSAPVTLEDEDIVNVSRGDYIIINADIVNLYGVQALFELGIIEIVDETRTAIITYKINCEKDLINKEEKEDALTYNSFVFGKFNNAVNLKNIVLDIDTYNFDYNYIYIPKLNRFYYVDSVDLITNNFTRLKLREDVLNSWHNLIVKQEGFIDRYENADDLTLYDERKPLEDKLTITTLPLYNTSSDSTLVNTSFDFLSGSYLLSAYSDVQATFNRYNVESIDIGYLPRIKDKRNWYNTIYKITQSDFDKVVLASMKDDTTASYFASCVYFPITFDTNLFKIRNNSYIYVGVESKHVGAGYFADADDTSGPKVDVIDRGTCPYLVVYDFSFYPRTYDFTGYEPTTIYEFFIPFYGWYKIPNPEKIFTHRLLIFYSVDYETGSGTVYLYDYTKHSLIFSSNVTLGIKTDIISTNNTENIKQKQASDLNMILSLVGAGVALGVGNGSALALTTGILSGTKAIASNVNTHNSIFDRAQTSLGASDNVLHAPNRLVIRASYHANITINDNAYKRVQGLPYRKYLDTFEGLTGYAEIPQLHFNPLQKMIYQDEIDEIINLLQNGVIF